MANYDKWKKWREKEGELAEKGGYDQGSAAERLAKSFSPEKEAEKPDEEEKEGRFSKLKKLFSK